MTPLSEVRTRLENITVASYEEYARKEARHALTHLAEVEAELDRLKKPSFIENATDVSELSRKLVEKNEQIDRLRAELDRVIEINRKFYDRTRYKKLKELRIENTRLVTEIKKARGTLGYGELTALPSTIQSVRNILDAALQSPGTTP